MDLKTLKPDIPNYIKEILDTLKNNGFQAFIVGGAVRDIIMGRIPDDYDITTNASPDDILSVFENYKTVTDGIKHGTVTVISEHKPVEITTYRVDGEYNDSRHPESITFTKNIKEDLSRRDLTVNAICYSEDGGFYDPFNGIDDIEKKIIRTVGNPERRFTEDALRIFRAIRFASVLGFKIERETENALFKYAAHLLIVSRERIFTEFKKLLLGKFAGAVLEQYLYIIMCSEPGFAKILDNGRDPIRFKEVDACKPDICERLTVFLICLARAESEIYYLNYIGLTAALKNYNSHSFLGVQCCRAKELLDSLRCDKKTVSQVLMLLEFFYLPLPCCDADVKRFCAIFNTDLCEKLCHIKSAFAKTEKHKNEIKDFLTAAYTAQKSCCKLSELAVSGEDIKTFGITGKNIGKVLEETLNKVIEGYLPNEKSVLLKDIAKTIKCK